MKLSNASVELKIPFFYEIIITVFQLTYCAIENRSACRRLPTPAIDHSTMIKDTSEKV
jgi:hypothetical protein